MNDTAGTNLPEGKHQLDMRTDELVEAAEIWAQERPEITDEEMASKCKDFIDQVRSCAKAIEDQRKEEKQPHIDAGKAIDKRWKALTARLDVIKAKLEPRMRAWLFKKDEEARAEKRRQEEEALKAAREAHAAQQEAAKTGGVDAQVEADQKLDEARALIDGAEKAPERGSVSGALGGKSMSLRGRWTFEIVDEIAIPCEWLTPDLTKIGQAVRRKDDPVREIPGVRIFQDAKAV